MILMPQIFDVTANENKVYKSNELEFKVKPTINMNLVNFDRIVW